MSILSYQPLQLQSIPRHLEVGGGQLRARRVCLVVDSTSLVVFQNRPSHTAYKVAIAVVALGAEPNMQGCLPPDLVTSTAEILIESGAAPSWVVRACQNGRFRPLIRLLEKVFGYLYRASYYGMGERKLFYERQVRQAISNVTRQVLVLGAGYDTLAWRLSAEVPEVNFLEIDHPATAKLKQLGLEKMGMRENLILLPVDLGRVDLPEVLTKTPHWNRAVLSLFLAEGLLMYLSPEAVQQLFVDCARCSPPGSRFAFDHFLQGADGRPELGRYRWLLEFNLKLVGEPILSSFQKEYLPQFLSENGWTDSPEMVGQPDHITIERFAVAVKKLG